MPLRPFFSDGALLSQRVNRTMKLSINIPAPAPRSGLVVAMHKRHGGKGGRMKDRRQGRAGAKNRMREYLADA